MLRPKIKIEDIKVGDVVSFENQHASNHTLLWEVVKKQGGWLDLYVNENGTKDSLTINIKDITYHTKKLS